MYKIPKDGKAQVSELLNIFLDKWFNIVDIINYQSNL